MSTIRSFSWDVVTAGASSVVPGLGSGPTAVFLSSKGVTESTPV